MYAPTFILVKMYCHEVKKVQTIKNSRKAKWENILALEKISYQS